MAIKDPGTLLSNATFGPGAFHDYYSAYGLGGLLGYVDNKEDPIVNPFGEPIEELPSYFENKYALTGKGLESFGQNREGVMNESNIKVVGKDKKTGGYLVMSKSGDKQGTVYGVLPTPDGSYVSAGVVKDNVPWDSNDPWWKGAIGILSVLAAPIMAYGSRVLVGAAQAMYSGAAATWGQAFSMASEAASAAGAAGMQGFNFLGAAENASFGAGSVGAQMGLPTAADTALFADMGMNTALDAYGTNFATDWMSQIVPDYASGAAPGEAAGYFTGSAEYAPLYTEAYDAAQLLAQGLSPEAVIQNLTATGLSDIVAADIVQLAQQGVPEQQIMEMISQSYPPEMLSPPSAPDVNVPPPDYGTPTPNIERLPPVEVTGANPATPGPSTTFEWGYPGHEPLNPATYVPPQVNHPGNVFEWDYPGHEGINPDTYVPPTVLEGYQLPENTFEYNYPGHEPLNPDTYVPPTVGPPPGGTVPRVPGVPGGNTNTGTTSTNPLNTLFTLADMWSKYQLGKDQMNYFNDWTNKIFGQSAVFENKLKDTYDDPYAWMNGPEGQALNRIVQNQALRTDAQKGNLSNDMNRSRTLQDSMMKGMGDYRGGLVNAANIGRSQSGKALEAAGRAWQGFADSRNFATPAAWASGQNTANSVVGTLNDVWNTGTNIWNTGRDIWNWFNS